VGVVSKTATLYKPIKRSVTIRLDVDVIAWFKQHAPDGHYQTEINRILRQHATGRHHGPGASIAVSPHAYSAIEATMPPGSVVYPPECNCRTLVMTLRE
jgi:hypothetical protein